MRLEYCTVASFRGMINDKSFIIQSEMPLRKGLQFVSQMSSWIVKPVSMGWPSGGFNDMVLALPT